MLLVSDADVLAIGLLESRVLVTNDLDFGDLVVRLGHQHAGVLLLRLPRSTLAEICERLDDVLARHLNGITEFIVVTRSSIRRR